MTHRRGLILATAAVLAGVSGAVVLASGASGPEPGSISAGRAVTTLALPEVRSWLDPAPAAVRPAVSAATAVERLEREFGSVATGTAEVEFGLYTNDAAGETRVDGTVQRFFDHVPAWVVVFRHVAVRSRGNGAVGDARIVGVVDAETGYPLLQFTIPEMA